MPADLRPLHRRDRADLHEAQAHPEHEQDHQPGRAGASLALSFDADPVEVRSVFPASVAAAVLDRLLIYRKAGQQGDLDVEAKYDVTNLDDLLVALDTYFNDTPIGGVNTETLF